MTTFEPGERVYVDNAGYDALHHFMRTAFRTEPTPVNRGVVAEIRDDGHVVVTFDDDGTSAPYPASQVHHLPH